MPDTTTNARIDALLVVRALHGDDRAAFAQLVRRYQGLVRAQLRRLTMGDRAWADDLAQEVFLHAWRKLDQFRGDARFATWLYRISYTIFLRATRHRKAEIKYVFEENSASLDERDMLALRFDLATALRGLSDREREALLHCYELDLSHEEAAKVLGIPVGSVKTHIAREG